MGWTAKPSGTMAIERREQPWLSDDMRRRYETEIIPRYERRAGAIMPILHDVQAVHGHIPAQAMEEIAELLGIVPGDVLDVVSFYEGYHEHPVGRHVVGVCQSLACELCGHREILDHLKKRLGVDVHETTLDGKITLLAMECLGACEHAPCALIDRSRHDDLTVERIDAILEELED